MNEIEMGRVLAFAASLDSLMPKSDPDGFIRRVWMQALHDVPGDVAQRAVVEYYRSDRYAQKRSPVSPADIVQWWNGHRRPSEAEQAGLNAATRRTAPAAPADPEVIRAGVDRVFAALHQAKAIAAGEDPGLAVEIAEGEAAVRREYRSRPCPHCQAREGAPCVDHRGRPLQKSPAHDSRMKAAEVQARAAQPVAVAELAAVEPAAVFDAQ